MANRLVGQLDGVCAAFTQKITEICRTSHKENKNNWLISLSQHQAFFYMLIFTGHVAQ